MALRSTMIPQAPLKRYAGWNLLFYIGILLAVGIIDAFIDYDLSRMNSFMPIFLAALLTGSKFAKNEGRNFIAGEKWKLALYCVTAIYAFSAVIVGGLFALLLVAGEVGLPAGLGNLSLGVLFFAFIIIAPIHFGITGLFLGMGTKNAVPKGQRPKDQGVEKIFD